MTETKRPRSPLLQQLLKPVMPRRVLYERLGTDTSRTNDLLQGQDPGTTLRFAHVLGQVVIPLRGRGPAGAIALDLLEELHPEAFVAEPLEIGSESEIEPAADAA